MINQAIFIVALPICLLLYYRVFKTPRTKLVFLLVASLGLYLLGGWQYLLFLVGLSLATFWLALVKRPGWGITVNILSLIAFKYWDISAGNINPMLDRLGSPLLIPYLSIGLPIGISFFVFKHIGYLIETRQAHYPPSRDFLSFLTFSAFFPQIVAGPISDYKQTSDQFRSLPASLSSTTTYEGLLMISMGLVKKVMIADGIAAVVNSHSVLDVQGLLSAWYLVIAFACQLYFDFSGYSDIALGIGRLLGVKLPENFDNPYLATNIGQFWERWHISLSSWFRYYFYSPFCRFLLRRKKSRNKTLVQVIATVATMILIGAWHGAAWTFSLWGIYHGLLLTLDIRLRRSSLLHIPTWIQRTFLVLSVLFGWAIFMSPDLPSFGHLAGQLFGIGGLGGDILALVRSPATVRMVIGVAVAFSGSAESTAVVRRLPQGKRWVSWAWGLLAALAILWMGTQVNFIYMQF